MTAFSGRDAPDSVVCILSGLAHCHPMSASTRTIIDIAGPVDLPLLQDALIRVLSYIVPQPMIDEVNDLIVFLSEGELSCASWQHEHTPAWIGIECQGDGVRVYMAFRGLRLAVGSLASQLAAAYRGEPIHMAAAVSDETCTVSSETALPVFPAVIRTGCGAAAVNIDITTALAMAQQWLPRNVDPTQLAVGVWAAVLARFTYRNDCCLLMVGADELRTLTYHFGSDVTSACLAENKAKHQPASETSISSEITTELRSVAGDITFCCCNLPSLPAAMILHLVVDNSGQACINYHPGRISRTVVEMISGAYVRLLTEIACSGTQVVDNVALGLPPEGPDDVDQSTTVVDLFAAQAVRTPDAAALVYNNKVFSYQSLDQLSDRMSCQLSDSGIGPGTVVGIGLTRSPDMIVSMLAVLKLGAAYLPLDLAYPPQRLEFMINDSGCETVIVDSSRCCPPGLKGVCFIDVSVDMEGQPEQGQLLWPRPDDTAYIIYTSGSTGRPKGVIVEHRSVANLVQAIAQEFDYRRGRRVLQFASPSFDASVIEIFGVLCNGGTLCLADATDILPGTVLAATLRSLKISNVTLTPSVLRVTNPEHLPDLKVVISAGEECDFDIVKTWGQGRKMINAYGPTESTVCAALDICNPADAKYLARPPIGRALSGMAVYVLDRNGLPLPAGASGELYIGGAGVARGYLGRPDLTREKFLPDPFSSGRGIMYRTGDLVRALVDGRIEFLGRVDQQVKLRGFRIELGEIESVIRDHPQIADAAVLSQDDRLVAFIIGRSHPQTVRQWVSTCLPDYMVPSTIVSVDVLPLTSSGKVDKVDLAAREVAASSDVSLEVDGPIVQAVVKAFADALGMVPGLDDNFFERGGHSLLATRVIGRLNARFDLDLTERDIFTNPTAAELAAVTEQALAGESWGLPPLEKVDRATLLPLSLPQERVWFIQRMYPDSIAYQAQAVISMRGQLDVGVLEEVLSEIVRRHEIFRTSFPERDGQPYQRIHEAWSVELSCIDVSDDDDPAAAAVSIVDQTVRHQFDIECVPLVNWLLIKMSSDEHQLVYVEHHLVHDGWSFTVFMSELMRLYDAFSRLRPSPLPEPHFQFADFANWQRQLSDSELVKQQLDHWINRLTPLPDPVELPVDRPRPAVVSFAGDALRVRLRPDIVGCARSLCQGNGLTLFMVMLAVFNVLLFRYTDNRHIVLATGIANRRRPELDNIIGMVINTLPVDNKLSPDMTFRDFLASVRDSTLDAYANQDVPVDKLVRELYHQRQTDRNPLFAVMFSFHDSPLPVLDCPGLTFEVTEGINNGSAKFDLNVVGIPRPGEDGDGMTMIWEFSTDLFDRSFIARMYEHFQVLARYALRQPDTRLSDLPLMTERERSEIVYDWNQTDRPVPDHCLHHPIKQWADKQPERTAVSGSGWSLTYSQLEQYSTALAIQLREAGAGTDRPVAILTTRSPHMIVAMVAALKAGAAYVPLDPSYPEARLEFMISDSDAAVVVCSEGLHEDLLSSVQVVNIDQSNLSTHADGWQVDCSPDSAAYIIYTSGTTGKPKGVTCSHRSVLNLLADFDRRQPLGPDDRCSFWTSSGFDVAVYEIFSALTAGAELVMVPEQVRFEGSGFIDWLCKRQITSAYVPPFMIDRLWEQATTGLINALRRLLVGVEPISHSLLTDINAAVPDLTVINGYGPTEATICTTLYTVTGAGRRRPFVPIGRPVNNARVYLLDEYLQPVPIGVPGRLYIGGMGLALGYHRQAELTAHKFIPDPFHEGSLMYDTGDIARYLSTGDIEFIGRCDDQLKIRGFRIEPGEVESVLELHQQISSAVVVPWKNAGEYYLAAYIVPCARSKPAADDIRQFAADRLPTYMVPTAYLFLNELPVTAHGKIDRKALPEPISDRGGQLTAPRTDQERIVLTIWQEVLGRDDIGIEDDFFSVGGHSLVAMRIISRMEQALGVKVPLRLLFTYPNVTSLCSHLRDPVPDPEHDHVQPLTVLDASDAAELLLHIDELSDEQVEELLERLSQQEVEQ